jgi:hypothetical protein
MSPIRPRNVLSTSSSSDLPDEALGGDLGSTSTDIVPPASCAAMETTPF